MIGGAQNIGRIPELQKRILFTFGMLGVYRIGSHIVTPGIDPEIVRATFERMSGTLFSLFNVFEMFDGKSTYYTLNYCLTRYSGQGVVGWCL